MDNLSPLLQAMKVFFEIGQTLSYDFRRKQLLTLKKALQHFEEEIYTALYTDLKKSKEECWVTENGFVMVELNNALRNLEKWMQPETVSTNLLNFPSFSKIINEPLGVVLIIAPWNYPLQLLFTPLIGAIAAGNCVVLKPSEFAPATSAVMKKIIQQCFSDEYILFVEGDGATVVPAMLQQFTFHHIFYTGSTAVGKIIYQLAAEKLVPVTLELGGKSPCIVESDANINIAAKRIAITKFSNCGQMCVAPDYVLVHESKKEELITALIKHIRNFFGEDASQCENYGKMINANHFDRVINYLKEGTIVYGGDFINQQLYIQPTIITNVSLNNNIMKDEIFGPILPIISFSTFEEAKHIIAQNSNPLAFYIFTSSNKKEKAYLQIPSGGVCVNNASWHLTNHALPFGGRGFSGTGQYHGKFSFDTFSHKKAVLKTPTWFDPGVKYPPFKGKLKLFKMLIK
ncbi:MAG: aldehyde dehydrogenase family protein [Chitinophaga sp.]|jgi:aldehyde dehydrogenase (NAD+)|nr:aldehyde dehydrogenase family protein [Chitinophaga sp.]